MCLAEQGGEKNIYKVSNFQENHQKKMALFPSLHFQRIFIFFYSRHYYFSVLTTDNGLQCFVYRTRIGCNSTDWTVFPLHYTVLDK